MHIDWFTIIYHIFDFFTSYTYKSFCDTLSATVAFIFCRHLVFDMNIISEDASHHISKNFIFGF